MGTIDRGNAAEAAVLHALVERDIPVIVPFGEGLPFDLVAFLGPGAFVRVQCKAARLHKGCLTFNARSTDHGRGRLSYVGLAELFGLYFPPTKSVYLVPVMEATSTLPRLRLDPPRNNQRKRVKYAADYAIDKW
jgi:hypothetical protein